MQLRIKLAAIAVAGSAAALGLSAGPAVASTHASTTGREVIFGAVHGKAAWIQGSKASPKVRVRFRGVVKTHSVVSLGSSASSTHSLKTPVGKLTVRLSNMHNRAKVLNKAICRLQYSVTGTATVRGSKSTGAFAGATGQGPLHVRFTFNYPKRPNGKCNYSNNAVPSKHGGLISFRLVFPALTVP